MQPLFTDEKGRPLNEEDLRFAVEYMRIYGPARIMRDFPWEPYDPEPDPFDIHGTMLAGLAFFVTILLFVWKGWR